MESMIIKNIIKDNRGQAAPIILFFAALLFGGFLYILLGGVVQPYYDLNNALISNPKMPYSQEHYDAMNFLFTYWWFLPIVFLGVSSYYLIKKSSETQTSEV